MSREEKSAHLNGIDLSRVSEMTARIKDNPALNAPLSFRTRSVWEGGVKSTHHAESVTMYGEKIKRNFSIVSDEPPEIMGKNSAPSPQEILFAGIAACVLPTFVVMATAQGIRLESVEMELEGTLDLRGFLAMKEGVPAGYPEIRYVFKVKTDASDEALEAVHQKVRAVSPNYWSLTQPVKMPGRIERV